nr:hypothetical protein [Streptomyces sp. MBT58]
MDQAVPATDTRGGRQADPLHIRPQPQPADQVDVQAGDRPAGGVRRDQHIHIARPQPGPGQGILRRGDGPVPGRLVRGP